MKDKNNSMNVNQEGMTPELIGFFSKESKNPTFLDWFVTLF